MYVVFDIDYLLIEPLKKHLYSLKSIEYQVLFLLQLIDFEINFKEYSNKIASNWYEMTEERYREGEYSLADSDKKFVLEYAREKNSLDKAKDLINKLCNCKDGVLDYDDIIAEAENEISTIQDISNFKFTEISEDTEKSKKLGKHTSIGTILGFKPNKE